MRRKASLRVLPLVVALGLALPARGAAGRGRPPAAARARILFEQAERLFRAGQFVRARRYYHLAYREQPWPALLLDIAQCHRNLGQCRRARAFFRRYLAEDPASPYRGEVVRVMRECRPAKRKPRARAAAGATGRDMRRPPPRASTGAVAAPQRAQPPPRGPAAPRVPRRSPGIRQARHPSAGEGSSDIGLVGGRRGGCRTEGAPRTRRILLWTGTALTSAAVTAGIVSGTLALARHERWQRAPAGSGERERLRESGQALSRAATASFAVAGVLAVSTAVTYLLYPRVARAGRLPIVAVGGAGLGISGTF